MGKSAFSRQVPRTWDHFCPQPQLAARVEVLHCWHLIYRKVPMNAYTLWWTNIAMENGHRNSGFSHEKWWFSIAMLVHQRVNVWYAYHLSWDVGVETRSVLPFLAASSSSPWKELPDLQESLLYRGQTLAKYLAARRAAWNGLWAAELPRLGVNQAIDLGPLKMNRSKCTPGFVWGVFNVRGIGLDVRPSLLWLLLVNEPKPQTQTPLGLAESQWNGWMAWDVPYLNVPCKAWYPVIVL